MTQEHGGNVFRYENVTDFSANLNPLGMPDSIRNAVLRSADLWERYPDPDCTALVRKLAVHEHIPEKHIVCGNGADDLLFRAVHALRPRKAVIAVPAFSEYEKALRETGCEINEYFLKESAGFVLDEGILEKLERDVDMLVLCSPNNPTGRTIPGKLLAAVSERCVRNDTVLLCDECFLDFTENAGTLSLRNWFHEKCMILKAFTKLYAMAGLRLGYMVCGSSTLAAAVRNSGQFWSVSAPAQAAGLAALGEPDFVRKTVAYVRKERAFLMRQLSETGITVFPSEANYLLLKAHPPLAQQLLAKGILIRCCDNFRGLGEGFFRIAVRTHAENIRLSEAVREVTLWQNRS